MELLGDERDIALVAVGGHGRRQLCPGSDLDLVLVHAGRKDVATVAERIWYPIWDAGVHLDHSVRTVKQALAVAAGDLKASLGLLDARPVAGRVELGMELHQRAVEQWRRQAKRWLETLEAAVTERHERFGEVAFLLEPDLKEGRGGLRDIAAVRAGALAAPILDVDDDQLDAAGTVLLGTRVELHRRTGKGQDRLVLQEQDGVAADLGHADADALMASVAGAGRTIAWVSDDAWRRLRSWRLGPKGRTAGGDRILEAGLVLRDGEVHLAPDADPAADRSLLVRAAAQAAELDTPMARATLDRLAADAPTLDDAWPDDARQALLRLLGSGPASIAVFEALDQRGLLVRVLPEWEPARSRPQRNAYHRFTVDRHLCQAAVEASSLIRQVSRPDLLLAGAWLHDLGKAYPGDHSEVGARLIEDIATRMGFAAADATMLATIVRQHLLLAEVASRRDLSDPATIATVADAVGDRTTLELLAAVTEADSKATGETAWTPWKAGLVRELTERVAAALEGGTDGTTAPRPAPPGETVAAARAALDAGAPVFVESDVDGQRIIVAAPDRPGLFSRVAGTLALHGLDVLSAEVWSSEDGLAVDTFRVEHAFGGRTDWMRLTDDLERALAGRLSIEARLAERSRAYAARRRTPALAAEPRVIVDDGASERATLVEVRAVDAIGVLYRITRALADLDLDVRYAKVATLGHEVVDTFYVRDGAGRKLDAELSRELEQAILAELARVA